MSDTQTGFNSESAEDREMVHEPIGVEHQPVSPRGVIGKGSYGIERDSTANPKRRSEDEADITIRLSIKIAKETRANYPFPNLHVVDCLRHDVKMYHDGEVSLAELIAHSGITGINVQVGR